ncbi:MAG: indolepyruvate ferredoxin oxidoreductase subunit alpha [Actinomycetota bacterium]|nr:indolepyruvate ferredoxin oxidoreductase subunit alpha [Actinomycetota bacterium]
MKVLLSGNEAIAYGAYAAGVKIASGYPGTPSTEILETLAKYDQIDSSWAPNEKVALEIGMGASLAGTRTIVTMKHVGLNVAAGPLFTLAYTGVNGGLVIINADDPSMHSSQNEQDNRYYAKSAKVPMLEPSDSQEAAWLVDEGLKISERFDIPVILRTTTRINHSKSLVDVDIERAESRREYEKDIQKYVMIPAHARQRRNNLEQRLEALAEFSEEFPGNRVEWGSRSIGFIADGVSYQYVKEVFPEASVLKITMVHPLPKRLISDFVEQIEKVIVVEELDPFIEDQLKAWGLPVVGKRLIPGIGELNPETIRAGVMGDADTLARLAAADDIPGRPPMMCAGCSHRGVFYILKKMKLMVAGDIGCYTLGVMPPLEAMDTCFCMGASIGNAMGFQKATGRKDVVAVIGDSTFMHSGITPLIDVVYNKGIATVIILDNRTTAMTGRQDHPGTGKTLKGDAGVEVDIEKLVRALGVASVQVVDPYDLKAARAAITEEISKDEPSVIIFRRVCLLAEKVLAVPLMVIDECDSCKACMQLGCPALSWEADRARIEPSQCNGCDVCGQICKAGAIVKYEQADQGAGI